MRAKKKIFQPAFPFSLFSLFIRVSFSLFFLRIRVSFYSSSPTSFSLSRATTNNTVDNDGA
jgi:hypothetical protein